MVESRVKIQNYSFEYRALLRETRASWKLGDNQNNKQQGSLNEAPRRSVSHHPVLRDASRISGQSMGEGCAKESKEHSH
jgi:hypothetical protein